MSNLVNTDDSLITKEQRAASNPSRGSASVGLVNRDMISSITSDTGTQERSSLGLKHVKEFMRNSTHFSEVTMEQIDRVRMMHDRFEEGCQFSFNYNTLLVVASILAGLGLVSDSPTTVIASMLVSPIMGPVVGIAYGATIRDWRLCRTALKTEILSLVICIIVGALIGAFCGPTKSFGGATRCILFGSGVAVSLLDEQTSSLVGVAISASLLPPSVNAGIIWVAYGFFEKRVLGEGKGVYDAEEYDDAYPTREYDPDYVRSQFRLGGAISLVLTLANVVLIILASMLMFRLKERLPIQKKVFWTDLGVTRKIYRNLAFLTDNELDTDDDNCGESESEQGKEETTTKYVVAAS